MRLKPNQKTALPLIASTNRRPAKPSIATRPLMSSASDVNCGRPPQYSPPSRGSPCTHDNQRPNAEFSWCCRFCMATCRTPTPNSMCASQWPTT